MSVEKTLENSFKLPLLILTGGALDVEDEIGNCFYYEDDSYNTIPRYKTCNRKATFVSLSTWTLRHAFRSVLDIEQRRELKNRSSEDGAVKCVHHMMQYGIGVIANVCAISVHAGDGYDETAARFVISMTNIHRPVYMCSIKSIPCFGDVFSIMPLNIIEKSRPILRRGVLPYGK